MTVLKDRTKRTALSAVILSVLLLGYGFGYVYGDTGRYILSGAFLMGMAAVLAVLFYFRNGRLLDMELIFSLFWFGGEGLSALKLSRLSQDWTWESWVSFFLVYVAFLAGYELLSIPLARYRRRAKKKGEDICGPEETSRRMTVLVGLITVVTFVASACFLYEAWRLQLIPLLSPLPHAYSEFHVSGVHYFTVSCVLTPALGVMYFHYARLLSRLRGRGGEWMEKGLVVLLCLMSLAIPVLAVSRFQLILAVVLAGMVWLLMEEGEEKESKAKRRKKTVLLFLGVLLLGGLYVGLSVARNHNVDYLNSIFRMKDERIPIYITQPYMYVANNFDNFNCLTWHPVSHAGGLRMAYPFIVLTGQKFLHPEWVSFPLYVTRTELTTLTLIYDAYYDFGILGVGGFGILLGVLCAVVNQMERTLLRNPVRHLIYAQAVLYLALSFFTTWYSNPATWFYYGCTVLLLMGMGIAGRRKRGDGKDNVHSGKEER